jgi:hypothetical protein
MYTWFFLFFQNKFSTLNIEKKGNFVLLQWLNKFIELKNSEPFCSFIDHVLKWFFDVLLHLVD